MNKIVNGVANDYEFSFLEKTTEDYYQVMNRYYTEEFVKKLQQELQRKDNIINELKEYISENWKVIDESPKGSFYEGYDTCIEEMKKDILDKIKELENDKR